MGRLDRRHARFSRWSGTLAAAASLGGTGALTSAAWCGDGAAAARLAREALALEHAGRGAAACSKLEEAVAADPEGGRMAQTALCYERVGQLGTAHSWWTRTVAKAVDERAPERERMSRERLRAVAARLGTLALRGVDWRRVTVDGQPARSESLVVTPGSHRVSIDGVEQQVTVGAGQAVEVRPTPASEVASPPRGALVLEFEAPAGSGLWSVRSPSGLLYCALPCKLTHGLPRGTLVQRDDGDDAHALPALDRGESAKIDVVPRRGSPVLATVTLILGGGLLLAGTIVSATDRNGTSSTGSQLTNYGLGGAVVGGLWLGWSRAGSVRVAPMPR